MTPTTIYVVQAVVEYEGSRDVCAFRDKPAAQAFCDQCNEHHRNAPTYPNDTTDDAAWEQAEVASDEWRSLHPAKEFGEFYPGCDFQVIELPLL
jgi:hypothetical protein